MSSNDTNQMLDKMSIASEIIKGRELLGLTQAQLASQSGVSLSAIKGYEIGRNLPGAKEIRQLCQVLRISPNRILFGEENPFPERTWPESSVVTAASTAVSTNKRIDHLLPFLSSGERGAIYHLVYSLAVSRHTVEEVTKVVRNADLEAGVDMFVDTETFIPHLHAKLLVDTTVARKFAASLTVAADETDKINAGLK